MGSSSWISWNSSVHCLLETTPSSQPGPFMKRLEKMRCWVSQAIRHNDTWKHNNVSFPCLFIPLFSCFFIYTFSIIFPTFFGFFWYIFVTSCSSWLPCRLEHHLIHTSNCKDFLRRLDPASFHTSWQSSALIWPQGLRALADWYWQLPRFSWHVAISINIWWSDSLPHLLFLFSSWPTWALPGRFSLQSGSQRIKASKQQSSAIIRFSQTILLASKSSAL